MLLRSFYTALGGLIVCCAVLASAQNDTCWPGYGKTASGCAMCTPGRFSKGNTPCQFCPAGKTTVVNASAGCDFCPLGLTCDVGLVAVYPGFWVYRHSNNAYLLAYRCQNPSLCVGGPATSPDKARTVCANGRLPAITNVQCATCDAGLSEWKGECIKCDGVNYALVSLAFVISWLYILLLHKLAQTPSGLVSVFMYFVQTTQLLTDSAHFFTDFSLLNVLGLHPETVAPVSLGCPFAVSQFERIMLNLLLPLGLFFELAIVFLVHSTMAKHCGERVLRFCGSVSSVAYLRTFLSLCLYSFTAMSAATFPLLDCMSAGDLIFVKAYPGISCKTSQYQTAVPIVIALLCATLVVPMVLAVFTCCNRKKIQEGQADKHGWNMLFEAYKPEAYYWHIVVVMRRLLYVVALAVIDSVTYRFVMFTMTSLASTLLHSLVKPYKDRLSNRMEALSLTLHTAIAVLLSTSDIVIGLATVFEYAIAFCFIGAPSLLFVVLIARRMWIERNAAARASVQFR